MPSYMRDEASLLAKWFKRDMSITSTPDQTREGGVWWRFWSRHDASRPLDDGEEIAVTYTPDDYDNGR